MDVDGSPVLSLLRTAHRLEGRLTALLAPLELSLSQLRVLWLVSRSREPLTVNQIREQMLDPAANVSRLLNKLMEGGLVAKDRGTDDQRLVRIGLTAAGQDRLARGGEALARGLAELDRLDSGQAEALRGLLRSWD